MFADIVKVIDKWSVKRFDSPENDECNSIISSVFELYSEDEFHVELIVRVVQILVEFDNDTKKTQYLREKYKILFHFWDQFVVPEIRNFNLKNRKYARSLNKYFGILYEILNNSISFSESKEIKSSVNSQVSIITSNIPKLLLKSICCELQAKSGNVFDAENILIDSKKLKNIENFETFLEFLKENPLINIYINCLDEFGEEIDKIIINNKQKFIFVVNNKEHCEKLITILNLKDMPKAQQIELNYEWNDLTKESQEKLLEKKVNFQNHTKLSFKELVKVKETKVENIKVDQNKQRNKKIAEQANKRVNNEAKKQIVFDYSEIIDYQFLNMLIEDQEISINNEQQNFYNDENMKFLYLPRLFTKVNLQFTSTISQEELLNEIHNQPNVLISDIAGKGKSWCMKNFWKILRLKNSSYWVDYIDLKQFVDEFQSEQRDIKFDTFMIKKILKLKYNYEKNIFKFLYINGKVIMMFDGFDEIAPNCSKFVSDLIKSFNNIKGNQMWIATRNYFEVDLKEILNVQIAYGLEEFNREDSLNIILANWVLSDVDFNKIDTKEKFQEVVKNSPNFDKYNHRAIQIVDAIATSNDASVGKPQFFKIISECLKNEKDSSVFEVNKAEIYRKCATKIYERWLFEKGNVRKEGNTKSLKYALNIWQFHQYYAIKSLFPKYVKKFFKNYDEREWPEEEIIACGFMSKKGNKFYFLHETFREFFAADFIANKIKKNEDSYVIKVFSKVISLKSYKMVRFFLNESIESILVLEKLRPKMKKYSKIICEIDNFEDYFVQNLDKLTHFVLSFLRTGNYQKVHKIIDESCKSIAKLTKSQKMFLEFQEFIFDFLKSEHLKDIILRKEIFHGLLNSDLNVEIWIDFVKKAELKYNRKFIQQVFKTINIEENEHVFHSLFNSSSLRLEKVRKCLEFMQNYLEIFEINYLICKSNNNNDNIFKFSIEKCQTKENFQSLWIELKQFSIKTDSLLIFNEKVHQKDRFERTILHCSANCIEIDIHELIWQFLPSTFENSDSFKNFVLCNDQNKVSYIHYLVQKNRNSKIIDLVFKELKRIFNEVDYNEIIFSINRGVNLLQLSASQITHLSVHDVDNS